MTKSKSGHFLPDHSTILSVSSKYFHFIFISNEIFKEIVVQVLCCVFSDFRRIEFHANLFLKNYKVALEFKIF